MAAFPASTAELETLLVAKAPDLSTALGPLFDRPVTLSGKIASRSGSPGSETSVSETPGHDETSAESAEPVWAIPTGPGLMFAISAPSARVSLLWPASTLGFPADADLTVPPVASEALASWSITAIAALFPDLATVSGHAQWVDDLASAGSWDQGWTFGETAEHSWSVLHQAIDRADEEAELHASFHDEVGDWDPLGGEDAAAVASDTLFQDIAQIAHGTADTVAVQNDGTTAGSVTMTDEDAVPNVPEPVVTTSTASPNPSPPPTATRSGKAEPSLQHPPQPAVSLPSGGSPLTPSQNKELSQLVYRLRNVPIDLSVRLAEKKMLLSQILQINVGSLITFQKPCEDLLTIHLNNKFYGEGEAVKIGENFGIKINVLGAYPSSEH